MTLAPPIRTHKTLAIALIISSRDLARDLGLVMDMPVAAMARQMKVNRTAVYEQVGRLDEALSSLATARPGRPPGSSDPPDLQEHESLQLTLRVLRFRLEHPGAVVDNPSRNEYSDRFRRFILTELDAWEGTQKAFAEAAGMPLDTLGDWVRDDRAGLTEPPPTREPVEIPVDASETSRAILEDFECWEGATRSFLVYAAQRHGVTPYQVAKVLRICGAIAPRPRRRFRHRGSTKPLSPGSLLVTDGKTLAIHLTGSNQWMSQTWQGIVDQATGCDTAVVISNQEDARAVRRALAESVTFMGGVPPQGLLHDNKPCYQDRQLHQDAKAMGTILVPATPCRPENKAIMEGAFSNFEQRVGTIRLDDSSMPRLIQSATREIIRAYTAATNGVSRAALDGLSREAALRTARPSPEQRARAEAAVRGLRGRHEHEREAAWRRRTKAVSRHLLDWAFERLGLENHDPYGRLREYLSIYEPAAIRQAFVVVSQRLGRDELDVAYAHRYLTKVIISTQETLDLERQSIELLELCREQRQDWVRGEREEYRQLEHDCDPEALAYALAERAAWGGLPVAAAFWTERLLELLEQTPRLTEHVRRFLPRLREAPFDRRLLLLDRIAALECGVL